jgi:hypothetical protein
MGGSTPKASRPREVGRDDFFRAACGRISADPEYLEVVLDGIIQVIRGNAEGVGAPIPGTRLYFLKTRPFPGGPVVRVVYTIDSETHATLRNIGALPDATPEEELTDLEALLRDDDE